MYWKAKKNALKSLYLQMDKITKMLQLPDDGNMPEESEHHLLPSFYIWLPKPNKTTVKDLLITVGCIISSIKGLFSRQLANTSHSATFADSRHSRIFCGDFSLLIFAQILVTIAHLESLWWLRINTCGLTRREWNKAPRALWGTQSL